MKVRIYKINIEHVRYGTNWRRKKIAAHTFNEAVCKTRLALNRDERIESVVLLESTED